MRLSLTVFFISVMILVVGSLFYPTLESLAGDFDVNLSNCTSVTFNGYSGDTTINLGSTALVECTHGDWVYSTKFIHWGDGQSTNAGSHCGGLGTTDPHNYGASNCGKTYTITVDANFSVDQVHGLCAADQGSYNNLVSHGNSMNYYTGNCPATPTPTPEPVKGSLTVTTDNNDVSWTIDHGVGSGSGRSGYYNNLAVNVTYTIDVTAPSHYTCDFVSPSCQGAPSCQLSPSNPDKTLAISCTRDANAPDVTLKCSEDGGVTFKDSTLGTCNAPNAVLSWISSNVDTCTASATPGTATWAWTGTQSQDLNRASDDLGPQDVNSRIYSITCSKAGDSASSSITVEKKNNAACVSNTIPTHMGPGESRDVTITFRNTGGTTWDPAAYTLRQQPWPAPSPAPYIQPRAIRLLGSVPPSAVDPVNGTVTVPFTITAPTTENTYNARYQMTQNPGGSFGDACGSAAVMVSNTAPTANPARVKVPNFCVANGGYQVSWTYNDADGDPQLAFQVQVLHNGTIVKDTGIVSGPAPQTPIPLNELQWDTTYTAQVRVQDSHDAWSSWTVTNAFTTPKHGYPSVVATWLPGKPVAKSPVHFDASGSTCYTDGNTQSGSSYCTFDWDFGDRITASGVTADHTYKDPNAYAMILRVSDADYFCTLTNALSIQKPVPVYREALPGQ